ncbi:MAG: DnaJ domain-containing protein, partial [Nitrospirae bacterium]|nr:DnaJ domain-containing protein [Nitrospirota bacterium]
MDYKDRRNFRRYHTNAELDLKFKSRTFKGKLTDYSFGGVSAAFENILPIGKGDMVELFSYDPEMRVFGEVVWSIIVRSSLKIGVKNIMRLRGLTKHFQFADILTGLQRGQKTGVLLFESGNIVKKIYIDNGDMVFAASNQDDDRLGDILLRDGIINHEQYAHSVSEMIKTGQRQGMVLVRLGCLDPQGLVRAVQSQVEEIIKSLFLFQTGSFSWEERPLPVDEVIKLKLSAANLIYCGIKGITDPDSITGELASLEQIPSFSSDPLDLFQDLRLDDAGRKMVSRIDGRTSIQNIISITGLDIFEALKTIYALFNTRMIELRDEEKTEDEVPDAILEEMIKEKMVRDKEIIRDPGIEEMIEDIHRRYESIGYYGILGVSPAVAYGEIKAAYYKAAKKYHPDMHLNLSKGAFKQKLSDIFSYVYTAYRTLSDPQKRKEYDRLLTVRPAKLSDTCDKARAAFEEGVKQFGGKNYHEAELSFGKAVYYNGTIAEYHYYSGLVALRIKKFRVAEKAFESALRLEPANPEYMAQLGYVYMGLG